MAYSPTCPQTSMHASIPSQSSGTTRVAPSGQVQSRCRNRNWLTATATAMAATATRIVRRMGTGLRPGVVGRQVGVAVVLLALCVVPAAGQPVADTQRVLTSGLDLWKCGKLRSNSWKECHNLNMDVLATCRTRRTVFASRSVTPPCKSSIWIVTDCSTSACTAGGGSIKCITRSNDAGTAWEAGPCDGGGTGESTGYTLLTTCTDGSADNSAAVQAAIDASTASGGTIVVPSGKTCGIGASVTWKSNTHLTCLGGGGFKARSGVGAAGMFINTTTLANASLVGCTLDLASLSGIEGVNVTGTYSNVTIRNNLIKNGSNANGIELCETTSAVGRDSWVMQNLFEGSGALATNDGGLKLCGGGGGFVIQRDSAPTSIGNSFRRLGGINLSGGGRSQGDVWESIRRQAVHGGPWSIDNPTISAGDAAMVGVDVPGVPAGNSEGITLSNRYCVMTFTNSATVTNAGLQVGGGKCQVEALGVAGDLSIQGGIWAGGAAQDIDTGTATSGSTTTSVADTGKSWTTSEWVDYEVTVNASGGSCGLSTTQQRWITANTATALTISPALPAQADSCTYSIGGAGQITSRMRGWVRINGINIDQSSTDFTSVDWDQIVLYDPWSVDISGNTLSSSHRSGQSGIRLVAAETWTTNYDTGTAGAGSSATVISTAGKTWPVGRWIGAWAELTGGSCAAGGVGTKRKVTANTSTTATVLAFGGSVEGCTYAFRYYDVGPAALGPNQFVAQCPSGTCGTYGLIEFDRQVPTGGTFRGIHVAGPFEDWNSGVPQGRPLVGWSDAYGDSGVRTAPRVIAGTCLGGASTTRYLGIGCDDTEANAQITATGSFAVTNVRCIADSGSGTTCTLRKNGADTALGCTEASGDDCTDTADYVRFESSLGDTLSIELVAPGSGGCNTSTGLGCVHHVELTVEP